jgi:predicted RNA binding protein YcfA (HicA-like mRNA interferase family)
MTKLAPISQRKLVTRLRRLGFEGPYAGGKHLLMVRGTLRLTIPNMHGVDIGSALLMRILKQAAVTREEWERAE